MGLLDVVTESDEIDPEIPYADYITVHKEGLRHRSVNIFVANSQGELAIAERSGEQEVSKHKYHVSAGGHVRLGQSYKMAALDQLQDELFHGQDLSTELRLVEVAKYQNDTRSTNKENTILYIVTYDGKFTLNKNEITRIFWEDPLKTCNKIIKTPGRYTNTFNTALEKYLDWPGNS